MDIYLVGLGKMGFQLAENLIEKGHKVIGFDRDINMKEPLESIGGYFSETLEELLDDKVKPKIIWLMLPAGTVTNHMVSRLITLLNKSDILIDGGNSKYTDSKLNAELASGNGIQYFDVGTSGGVSGARSGACMMIGGDKTVFEQIEPLFKDLCVTDGYLYCGDVGSGHYLKMIHNGIEYGMMQSIGEGFNILHHSEYNYDLEAVAKVFNNGSVIRSWLMELTENLLSEDSEMTELLGVIPSSGEGKWTVEETLRLELSAPVITQALLTRYSSIDTEKYGEKIIASLRNQFGGHAVNKKVD